LQRLPAENSVRYWSVISDQNILLMGRDIDTLAELSSVTWPVDCW
jgi:hypothetical protein